MSISGWKSEEDRIKAPKGTRTVPITWIEFEKLDAKTFFNKWEAVEYLVKNNKRVV